MCDVRDGVGKKLYRVMGGVFLELHVLGWCRCLGMIGSDGVGGAWGITSAATVWSHGDFFIGNHGWSLETF